MPKPESKTTRGRNGSDIFANEVRIAIAAAFRFTEFVFIRLSIIRVGTMTGIVYNGLWDYADEFGKREIYAPLAGEIAQRNEFQDKILLLRKSDSKNF